MAYPPIACLQAKIPTKIRAIFFARFPKNSWHMLYFLSENLRSQRLGSLPHTLGLVTAGKKDSQGLCFVGKVRLPEFLQQQLSPKEGKIVEIDAQAPVFGNPILANGREVVGSHIEQLAQAYTFRSDLGKVIGTHMGAHFYTIGQRKGLHVGGKPEPLYVIDTDVEENIVYVGMGDSHPGLYRSALFIPSTDIHWIRRDQQLNLGEERAYSVRIRYRQPLQKARLICKSNGLYIHFEVPQRGITPGQFAAWYEGGELIGSGVIG